MGENDKGERVTLANPCHPGEILRDCIREGGETVTGAAKSLGMSRAGLNRVLAGQSRMTARLALALETHMGWSNAAYWLRLQNAYDLAQERRKAKAA